eukprot:gene14382-20383_t
MHERLVETQSEIQSYSYEVATQLLFRGLRLQCGMDHGPLKSLISSALFFNRFSKIFFSPSVTGSASPPSTLSFSAFTQPKSSSTPILYFNRLFNIFSSTSVIGPAKPPSTLPFSAFTKSNSSSTPTLYINRLSNIFYSSSVIESASPPSTNPSLPLQK